MRARPPAKGGTYVRARRLVRPNGRKMDARLPPEMSPGGGSHRVGSSLRDVLSTAIRESGPVGDGSKTRGSCFVKPLNKTLLTYPEAETHTHRLYFAPPRIAALSEYYTAIAPSHDVTDFYLGTRQRR